jgi:hypothetical protein
VREQGLEEEGLSMKCAVVVCTLLVVSGAAHAGEPAAAGPATGDAAAGDTAAAYAPVAPPPPPYSLAWQLRPAMVGNVIRADSSIAAYSGEGDEGGVTVATTLAATYKVTPSLAPLVRIGVAHSAPPGGEGATIFTNPVIGAIYALRPAPSLRLGLFFAATIPVGQGGGDTPDAAAAAARGAGILARSSMDNAMFAVNDLAVIPGVDLAWVDRGFTVQVEATLFQLTRVRGAEAQKDSSKTNLTAGLHVGWFALPWLSIGSELRYQRYLSTPSFVTANEAMRDTLSAAAGVRFHVKRGTRWLRPGIAYVRGLDDPMSAQDYGIVQLDLPFAF